MARNNKKSAFSKGIVIAIIFANIVFTSTVLWVFFKTSVEPSTLIMSWFSFTTVEVWSLASIKKAKEKNGGNNDG